MILCLILEGCVVIFMWLIIFSSFGAGYRMMLRQFEAAEKTVMLLGTADYFGDHTLDYYDQSELKKVSGRLF